MTTVLLLLINRASRIPHRWDPFCNQLPRQINVLLCNKLIASSHTSSTYPPRGKPSFHKSTRRTSWASNNYNSSTASRASPTLSPQCWFINNRVGSVTSSIFVFPSTFSWLFLKKRHWKNGLRYSLRFLAKTAGIGFTCMAVDLWTYLLLKGLMNWNPKPGNPPCPKPLSSPNSS